MRHVRGGWLLVGAASFAVLVGGCREPRDGRATTGPGTADGVAADFQDGWITTKVQAKYFTEPDVRGRDIDVTTNAGVVTLSGTVESEQARQRAVALARETDGVVRVDDRLALGTAGEITPRADTAPRTEPVPPPAPAPRADAGPPAAGERPADAPYARPGTEPRPGDTAGVQPGDSGAVGTGGDAPADPALTQPAMPAPAMTDRAAAGAAVPAAIQAEQRSDEGITTRIQARFFTDDQVRARHINVTTRDQTVTLEGTVQSDAERQHALALARDVEGVRAVEDRLQVEGTTGPARRGDDESGAARSATDGADDGWITTQVRSRYYVDDLLRGTRVEVNTQRGVVTLTGEVPSEAAKRRAEQLARETQGAMRVENRLNVRGGAGDAGAVDGRQTPERPPHGYQGQPQPAQPGGARQDRSAQPAPPPQ